MKERKRKVYRNMCVSAIIICILVGITNTFIKEKKKNEAIILGFSAQLTGRQAELGVQERNGAQLAIEKVNELGGIDGHKVSLITHDDLGNTQEAEDGDKELIEKGVVAIIGHATTSQTLAALNATNSSKVVMMGPTVSTPKLSGLDDYFFRIHPSFEKSSQNFAKYIYEHKSIHNIAIIFDKENIEYSGNYSIDFLINFNL